MRVAIIGAGRVGLTTAMALDYLGHRVTCVDIDDRVVEGLRNRRLPFPDPILEGLWGSTHIEVVSRLSPRSASSDLVMVTVPTPSLPDGHADISAVRAVVKETAQVAPDGADIVLAIKSTVPPGTTDDAQRLVDETLNSRKTTARIFVACNPEFLRQGSSLWDTLYPDRIVIGADGRPAARLIELHDPIIRQRFSPPPGVPRPKGLSSVPVVVTRPVNAELIKYASNAFLATKLSFINEVAGLAEKVGADTTEVAKGVGLDKRIGPHYFQAGPGWGGPCLGKDTQALLALAADQQQEMPLLTAARTVNARRREHIVARLEEALGSFQGTTIGVLGLSFKAETDDVSDSPALDVAARLIQRGARVRCYDPVAEPRTMRERPELPVEYHDRVSELIKQCDALLVMTEWAEFQHLPWPDLAKAMRGRTVLDARNFLDRQQLEEAGFTYMAIGR
ncbi:MAG: UDP-glucose dehydrogenase family protein [Dehalococcoidia bacterium]